MPSHLPSSLERIAKTLIPPASAEHVLGDLAECSRSRVDYLRHLVSVVPRLVWCHVRRRATIGGLIFNAILTGIALVLAQRIAGGRFLAAPPGTALLAVPWATWIIGCALAAAYGPADKPYAWSRRVFAATIVVSLAAGALIGVPTLRLAAGLAAAFIVSFLLAMPFARTGAPPPLSLESLPQHAQLFQRSIRWRNAREQFVGAVLIVFNAWRWPEATGAALWGHVLLTAGILFIIGYLHFKARPRRVPDTPDVAVIRDFHCRELARQRDILRDVALWYLLPFVPGLAAMTVHSVQARGAAALAAVPVLIVVLGVVWALNMAGVKFLEGQLRAVEALPQGGGESSTGA